MRSPMSVPPVSRVSTASSADASAAAWVLLPHPSAPSSAMYRPRLTRRTLASGRERQPAGFFVAARFFAGDFLAAAVFFAGAAFLRVPASFFAAGPPFSTMASRRRASSS